MNGVGVVGQIAFEVSGSQLHNAGLQGVPPPSPSVPNHAIICHRTVVSIGVVQTIEKS